MPNHRFYCLCKRQLPRLFSLLAALSLLLSAFAPAAMPVAAAPMAPDAPAALTAAHDNASYWENFTTAPAAWTLGSGFAVSGGELVSLGDNAYAAIYDGSTYSGEFVYRLDARNTYASNGNTARILFNYQDADHFYSISLGGGGEVKLTKGWWTDLAVSSKSFTPGSAATYEISYDNGTITVKAYRDNTVTVLFDRFVDPSSPITSGKVGVGAAWAVAHFDNLEVTIGAYRDPLHWPFAQDSIWNTPIGSDAILVPAGIITPTQAGLTLDEDVIILTPDAPLMDVYFNFEGWGNRNEGARCVAQGGLVDRLPVPESFIRNHEQNTTPNASAGILMPDGRTIKQNQPFHRCTGFEYATTGFIFQDADLYGDGRRGAHGGSGMSSIGGTLRLGELIPGGSINHALKINMFGHENYYYDDSEADGQPGYRWPAFNADGYAGETGNAIRYAGTNPALQIGSLLALHPSLDLTSLAGNTLGLESEAGLILARAFQNYGAYTVDDTAWSVYGITTEWGPDGRMDVEFENEWGFPMGTPADPAIISDPAQAAWARDVRRIFQSLYVVNNNGPENVGGGGTPRVPLAESIRPWRVLPLGDSLTAGGDPTSDDQSYRGDLYNLLFSAGFTNVDFVGTQWGATYAGGDPAHEGHGGYSIGPDTNPIGNIYDNIENYLNASNPDLVLMLIGINDMFHAADGVDPATAPERLAGLVDRLLELRPDVTILLSSLVPVNWGDDSSWVEFQAVNLKAEQIANASADDRIFFVDMYGTLDGSLTNSDYLPDNLHLTATGAAKVAQVWFDALTQTEVGLQLEPPPPAVPQAAGDETDLPYGEKKLHGTPFGSGAAAGLAFDGNPESVFTAAAADGAFAALDLGRARQITKIRYYPAAEHPDRMLAGRFQGSNSPDSGYVDLAVLSDSIAPAVRWQTLALENTQAYRYVRYLGADGSHATVAEIEFWTVGDTQPLNGTPFGLGPSWGDNPDTTFDKVFDGDTATFYDYFTANGGFSGMDLGPGNQAEVTAIRYYPRSGWEARMLNGLFEASNVMTDTGYSLLNAVGSIPQTDWNTALITAKQPQTFRYLRYFGPEGGYGNIAEAEFWTAYDTEKLNGTPFGTTPPVEPPGPITYTVYLPLVFKSASVGAMGIRSGNPNAALAPHTGSEAFDGDVTTFAPGNVAGLDLGEGRTAPLAVIRYYPRPGYESDLAGGKFQGAVSVSGAITDTASTDFVDIYTVPASVEAGWNTFLVGERMPYRFVRFVGAEGSIAEIEFWTRSEIEAHPAIVVEKTANQSEASTGDVIEYRYFIANNGAMTVTVEAMDDRLGAVALPDDELTPGETVIGTLTYPVTIYDALGPITNTVIVTATTASGETTTASDNLVVEIVQGPELQVVKSANVAVAGVGQTVTYTYAITNISGVPVFVEAYDSKLGMVMLDDSYLLADEDSFGTLAYTVLPADLPGPLTNTVVVTGSQWSPVYMQDFSEMPGDWTLSSAFEVSGGVLQSVQPDCWGGTYAALYDGATYSGVYAYTLDVTNFVGGDAGNTLRVIFNYQDENNFYSISLAGSGTVELRQGWWDVLATSSETFDRTQPATVEVQYNHGAISALLTQGGITKTLFAHVVDASSPLTSGKVGVGTAWNYVAVDHVTVSQLSPLFTVEQTLELPLYGLAVEKSANVSSAAVGETVTYTYLVTNTGSIPLAISAEDDQLGSVAFNPAVLPPGEAALGELAYTLQVADLPGPIVNTVTVAGATWVSDYAQDFSATPADWSFMADATRPGNLAVDTVTGLLYATQWPGLAAALYDGETYNGIYRYTVRAIGGGGDVGNAISLLFNYQDIDNFYQVRLNAGSGADGTVELRRGWGTVLATSPIPYNIHTWGDLELIYVNGSLTVNATQNGTTITIFDALPIPDGAPLTSGKIGLGVMDNGEARFDDLAVSVGGTPTLAADSFSLDVISNSPLAVQKSASQTLAAVGETLTYTYEIYNASSVTYTLAAVDDKLGPVSLDVTDLPPGQTATGSLTYTVQAGDYPAITNIVVVTGTDSLSNQVIISDTLVVNVAAAGNLAVVKTGSASLAWAGNTITYHYLITNTGSTALVVSAVDDQLGPLALSDADLAPGESATASAAYTTSQADLPGPLANTVTVTGVPVYGPNVVRTADWSVALLPGGPRVIKTASSDSATLGETVTYTYTITNQGNVNYTVSAVDDLLGAVTLAETSLAPGQSTVGTLTHTITTTDLPGPLVNTVTVTGISAITPYTQDFAAVPSDWTLSGGMEISGGTLNHPGWDLGSALYTGGSYADAFALTVDMIRGWGGGSSNASAILFNHQGGDNFYLLAFNGAGEVQLRRGWWDTIATSAQAYTFGSDPAQIYLAYINGRLTLTATRLGTTLTFFDNTLISGSPLTSGQVGFGTLWNGGTSFDNLSIGSATTTDQDTFSLNLTSTDDLVVEKLASTPSADVGDVVTYTYRVINMGAATYDIVAYDDQLGPLTLSASTLAAGEVATAQETYTIQPGDLPLTNVVVVTGTTQVTPYTQDFAAVPGDWTLSGGMEISGCTLNHPGWDLGAALYGGDTYADAFSLEVDMTRGWGGGSSNASAILFNYQDENNFYLLAFNGAGEVQLRRGWWDTLATSAQAYTFGSDPAQIHLAYTNGRLTLTATRLGDTLTFFDGYQIPGDPLTSGQIGFGTLWNGGTTFDNLVVGPVVTTASASVTVVD